MRRHAAALMLAVGLLGGVYAAPATWHAALGIAVLAAGWAVDPLVAKRVGAPRRWVGMTAILAAIGLWLGPMDGKLGGVSISAAGALAATTMTARALGLVLLGSAAGALYPAERALARLRRTRLQRFAEVLVVALDLVPSLVDALRAARARMGIFETFVFAVEHASALADTVARRLSAPEEQG